ncbi:MAG: TetR/AcrR family transcriptional regulator [Bacteroidetes bacterium]|nr:TetR/AcrR family transcriptional regulator [Bacteroidota bacterium]
MKTEERIIAKALEMFNLKGIEYVGMRELAAILDMRVSNITYYFPTKDDLVNRLSMDLNKLNSKYVKVQDDLTLAQFLMMFKQVFKNHIQYRCLLLSFVHLLEQNKKIAARYKKRRVIGIVLRENIHLLIQFKSLTELG